MGEVLKRTLSGAVFVAVPVFSLLYLPVAFVLFIGISAVIAAGEFNRLQNFGGKTAGNALLMASAVSWAALLLFHLELISKQLLTGFVLAALLILIILVLFSNSKDRSGDVLKVTAGYLYTQLGFMSFYFFGLISGAEFAAEYILFIFILIWTNDSFAYLTGRSVGSNKLYPSLSPGKTWEGTLGGAIFAIGAAYLLSTYVFKFNEQHWIFTGIIVAVFSTTGDLFQSALKRDAGVKDSGKIIPGHGGILDRFDAALFAFPACTAYLYLLY